MFSLIPTQPDLSAILHRAGLCRAHWGSGGPNALGRRQGKLAKIRFKGRTNRFSTYLFAFSGRGRSRSSRFRADRVRLFCDVAPRGGGAAGARP